MKKTIAQALQILQQGGIIAIPTETVYGLAVDASNPTAIQACAMATEDAAARGAMERYLAELRYVAPTLSGSDIMALGVPEGPLVGKALEALLSARLDGEVLTRLDEERLVRDRRGQ